MTVAFAEKVGGVVRWSLLHVGYYLLLLVLFLAGPFVLATSQWIREGSKLGLVIISDDVVHTLLAVSIRGVLAILVICLTWSVAWFLLNIRKMILNPGR